MIGLDTNVIVRYIMQDDARQSKLANELLEGLTEEEPGFLSIICLVELVWVLESAYGLARTQVVEVLSHLTSIDVLKVERAPCVIAALKTFKGGKADFADCLIEKLCLHAGCQKTVTFDRVAARTAHMVLLS